MAAKVPTSGTLSSSGVDPSILGIINWVSYVVQYFSRMLFNVFGPRVNLALPEDGSEAMTNPLPLRAFTVATRPSAAAWAGAIIYVSDGGAGAVFQGSNGSAWVNLG